MKKTRISTYRFVPLLLAVSVQSALAQESNEESAENVEKISVVGSRSFKQRSVSDSPVPVDLLDADDLNATGNIVDLTDGLKTLVPSFTATPATGDGSAFVRPTSLRGTAPDQTLVLVDGKRRHRSALVQFFAPAAGNGAHGVDIGMIPGIALKRVEVLRDGAASQYGSDAIAGVMNFVTKDSDSEGSVQLQYGQFYENSESSLKVGVNKGFAIGDDGFVNISLEHWDNEALSRGVQRPNAQALIDAGVQGVGADAPFDDAPFVQTWGRPETDGTRFFLNSGYELSGGQQIYGRLGLADTFGRYRFFYRAGDNPATAADERHSTLAALSALGYAGPLNATGFTPFLDGDQTDFSLVIGIEGELANDTVYDFSISQGSNELDYFLNNTINAGLGVTASNEIPQMDFNVGGYEQEETNINLDFSKPFDEFNLAYGLEYREETFTAKAGEPASYSNADGSIGAGSSGFKGITPQDSGEFSRDNYAVYVDVEQETIDDLLLQYALRYEDFSDFGSTLNWKVAGNYGVTEDTNIRAAISTGFHAPTPGQSNVRTTITTFDGTTGLQVEEGLIPATDPRAIAAGGQAIKEEESMNFSFGITSQVGDATSITLDLYKIEVDDRIYRTGDITQPDGSSISFYTNAIDVEHEGLDLVISSELEWSGLTTDVNFVYSYNKVDVVGQRQIAGIQPVSDATVEDIENNYPNSRWVFTTNTPFNDVWNLMVRANFYGSHYDERGTIGAATNPSAEIGSTIYMDAELSWQVTEDAKVRLGFSNIFDEYVDEVDAPFANRQSVGLQYPRRSAANYEGGSWYLGVTYAL